MKTVLVVDDSTFTRGLIKMTLKKAGYEVAGEAEDGRTAIALCKKLKPDLVTLDNILPDMFGVEVLQELVTFGTSSRILMISSLRNERVIDRVKNIGASGYLQKPFQPQELINALEKACYDHVAA